MCALVKTFYVTWATSGFRLFMIMCIIAAACWHLAGYWWMGYALLHQHSTFFSAVVTETCTMSIPHFNLRTKAVHVDVSVFFQLPGKFTREFGLYCRRKVPERISERQLYK